MRLKFLRRNRGYVFSLLYLLSFLMEDTVFPVSGGHVAVSMLAVAGHYRAFETSKCSRCSLVRILTFRLDGLPQDLHISPSY